MPYRGYHDPKTLPVKAGDTVLVPKGTPISGGAPPFTLRDTSKAGRNQRVKVDHVLCGSSMRVGLIYPDGETSACGHHRELTDLCFRHGIPTPNLPYDEVAFRKLWELPQAEKRAGDYGLTDVWFHLSDPTVVWAGKGGYWREVNINDVLPPEG